MAPAAGRRIATEAMVTAHDTAIEMEEGSRIPGLWMRAPDAFACLALAHGAGAGMGHRAMAALAEGLAERGVTTLRYDFPFMARGSRRPDPPGVAHAAVRAAVAQARRGEPDLPLFAGGRSFGGRMTSQAKAETPLDGVRGLVFFAFPLHPAGKPSVERAAHLADVGVPMLFLQGTRDALADPALLKETVGTLGRRASVVLAEEADHSFHVPARTGRKDPEVLAGLLDAAVAWMRSQL